MRAIFGKILLATSLISAPAAFSEELFPDEPATDTPEESAMWYGAWRCDAWPVMGPGLYYWINYNGYIARDNAMAACQMNTGMSCYFRCYRI